MLGEGAFLPRFPREILQAGEMQRVEVMFGVTQDEGLLNVMDILVDPENDTNFATVRDNWDRIGPYQLFDQALLRDSGVQKAALTICAGVQCLVSVMTGAAPGLGRAD